MFNIMIVGALDVKQLYNTRFPCLLRHAGSCATESLHSRPERGRRATLVTWRPRPSSQSSWCAPMSSKFLMMWQVVAAAMDLEQVFVDVQVAKLQQEVKTLERENVMLRQVIRNMQGGGGKVPDSS